MKISIIVPVYFNEMNLYALWEALQIDVLSHLEHDYEVIMVDDGSGDDSYEVMCDLARQNPSIRTLKLSRNFGAHAAILAGLGASKGDCATSISADLQDPPSIILEMLEKWKSGTKTVLAVRQDREEPFLQKLTSNAYYSLMRKFALPTMPHGGFDCFLIDRKVVNVLTTMEERNTTLMGQILWCGFKSDMIYYTRKSREAGKSHWTLSKKIKLFIDSLLGFSYAPIRFISLVGAIFFVLSIIGIIYIVIEKASGSLEVVGWASLFVLSLFSFGTIMITLGIIGEYVWRAFDSSRKRPPYIIDEDRRNGGA